MIIRTSVLLPLAFALAAVAGPACGGPQVRPAPFRVRPDSVTPGDLRGPYEGRVVDAETDRPISSAIVYATWTFVSDDVLAAPAGYREHLASTDADGRYRIPRLNDVPDDTRLTDFHLVVYKRGYVGFRSDHRFNDLGRRTDFTQRGYRVPLLRWRSDFSHARHLRYLGGGPMLRQLTAADVPEAAAELAGAPAQGPAPGDEAGAPTLQAERLLTGAEIARVTGYDGEFDVGDLGDEPSTAEYDSVHFEARGHDQTYDVALRLWRFPTAEAVRHFDRLRAELPGAKLRNELADRSLRASTPKGDILGTAFLDARRGVVVLVQCGASQCRSPETLLSLARHVYAKVEVEFPVRTTP